MIACVDYGSENVSFDDIVMIVVHEESSEGIVFY